MASPERPILNTNSGDGVVIQVQLFQLQKLSKGSPRNGLNVVFLQMENPDILGQVHGEFIQLVTIQVDCVHRLDVVQLCRKSSIVNLVIMEVEDGYTLRYPKRH